MTRNTRTRPTRYTARPNANALAELRGELVWLRGRVQELAELLNVLGNRVTAIEHSPFAANREKYERHLLDLRQGSPGVAMFPG